MATDPITIAVDAAGGAKGTESVVRAVAKQSRRRTEDRYFQIVGDERLITDCLSEVAHNAERIAVVHAAQTIVIDTPTTHVELTGSSIERACKLVAEGHADALVSCGHPGASVRASAEHFQKMPNVREVAMVAPYPTSRPSGGLRDRLSLLLDVGATMRADSEDLLSFAMMGSAYSTKIGGVLNPRVALLTNSAEGLSPPEIIHAHELLTKSSLHYLGTIEGHQVPTGDYDVVVCEGFVGNIAWKLMEGAGDAMFSLAKSAYETKFSWRMGLRLLSGGLERVKTAVDFESYGGVPLLGLDHVVIVADPRSTQVAISNAIDVAFESHQAQLPTVISDALAFS